MVDRHHRRWTSHHRSTSNEPLGVRLVRGLQRRLALRGYVLDAAEEHLGRREQRKTLVVMVVVVPAEERLEPSASMQR